MPSVAMSANTLPVLSTADMMFILHDQACLCLQLAPRTARCTAEQLCGNVAVLESGDAWTRSLLSLLAAVHPAHFAVHQYLRLQGTRACSRSLHILHVVSFSLSGSGRTGCFCLPTLPTLGCGVTSAHLYDCICSNPRGQAEAPEGCRHQPLLQTCTMVAEPSSQGYDNVIWPMHLCCTLRRSPLKRSFACLRHSTYFSYCTAL